MTKLVAYTRVSTSQQGDSGLGLAAQLRAIREFAKTGEHEIIKPEFVEVQSGTDEGRPELAKAVKQARLYGATLIVAKADRLTRTGESVEKFAKRNKIAVFALDNINGDDVLSEMQAFIGSLERKLISKRTKAALAAKKASGGVLGGYRGVPPKDYAQRLGAATVRANADRQAADIAEVIAEIEADQPLSLAAIAASLNQRGIATARGGKWSATQVMRVKARS
jgi:DNA invertase Pin-like site-specific DNA recombinase